MYLCVLLTITLLSTHNVFPICLAVFDVNALPIAGPAILAAPINGATSGATSSNIFNCKASGNKEICLSFSFNSLIFFDDFKFTESYKADI